MTMLAHRTRKENFALLAELYRYSSSAKFDNSYVRKCVLAIITLKYISDDWHSKYQYYIQQYDNNKELVDRKMGRERFILPSVADFNYLYKYIDKPDLGNIINIALLEIEFANKRKLEGLFRDIDFNNPIKNGTSATDWVMFLSQLVKIVSRMALESATDDGNSLHDMLSQVLNFWPLMMNFARGEYYRPPMALCDLLVELMSPKAGERIYDPACYIGALLVKAAAATKDPNGNPSDDYAIYGQEALDEISILTKINMLIHELDDAQIRPTDPIRNPIIVKERQLLKFDVLLSSLPWNIDKWGYETAEHDEFSRFKWGCPPETKGDLAYLQHMIATASDKGRIGIIVPNGVLFREGKELSIRKGIVNDNLLEAVIALPSNLFYGTKQACTILLLNKAKGENRNILFVNASKDYQADKRQHVLREKDIERIVSTYNNFKNNPHIITNSLLNYSVVVTPQEIADNNYNLTVSRYVDQNAIHDLSAVAVEKLQHDLEMLKTELKEIRMDIYLDLKKLGVEIGNT
jgi:type I restriction enzyme M protein